MLHKRGLTKNNQHDCWLRPSITHSHYNIIIGLPCSRPFPSRNWCVTSLQLPKKAGKQTVTKSLEISILPGKLLKHCLLSRPFPSSTLPVDYRKEWPRPRRTAVHSRAWRPVSWVSYVQLLSNLFSLANLCRSWSLPSSVFWRQTLRPFSYPHSVLNTR